MPVDQAVFVGCSLFIVLKKPTFIVNLMIMSCPKCNKCFS